MILAVIVAAVLAAQPSPADPYAELALVNSAANRSIRQVADREQYGIDDVWVEGAEAGDCEDIAIAKRDALLALGWPAKDLRLVHVNPFGGEGHAILEVRWSGHEPVLLDNMFEQPISWRIARSNGYDDGYTMRLRPARTETLNGHLVTVVGP
jgi:predicted transglutaminase-like cysteine proteinase